MNRNKMQEQLSALISGGAMVDKTQEQEQGEPHNPVIPVRKVQFNVEIDAELKAKLGIIAEQRGMKKKDLVTEIITNYVESNYIDNGENSRICCV